MRIARLTLILIVIGADVGVELSEVDVRLVRESGEVEVSALEVFVASVICNKHTPLKHTRLEKIMISVRACATGGGH